jgi:hypothetical protein
MPVWQSEGIAGGVLHTGGNCMSAIGDRPAFPVSATTVQQGVSLRDWLAAMALQGVVAKGLEVIGDRLVGEAERNLMMARRAYSLADAMLQVANESPPARPARTK